MHPGIFYMCILFSHFLSRTSKLDKQPTSQQIPQTTNFTNSSLVMYKGYLLFTKGKHWKGRQEKKNICSAFGGSFPSHNEHCHNPGILVM